MVRSERGMALPMALFAMIASFALASAAVLSSVDAQQGTKRDHESKEAIAAADAGAGVALLRLNRFESKLSASNHCVGPAGESLPEEEPRGSGWCQPTPPESVGGATFSYMVSAFKEGSELSVVAVGAAGGVSRRVNVKLASPNRKPVFLEEKMIGESGIELKGGDVLNTSLGTNGSVVESSEGKSAVICGNIRKGIGQAAPTPNSPPTCPEQGTVTEGNKTLPPVVLPEGLETNNTNYRLARCTSPAGVLPKTPSGCEEDAYQGKSRTGTSPWDPEHRFINIPNGANLTLSGKDYFVCGLFVEGTLIMASGSEVRIFFDTPEHCTGLKSGNTQIEIGAGGNIESTALDSSACLLEARECKVPGLYVMGSPTIPTTVDLGGHAGSTNELVLYAPYSDVKIHGNVTWTGMFAGKTMTISGNATIKSDARIPQPKVFFPGLLERTRYVECTGASAIPPDASC
jgi:hypothetical protein